MKKKSVTSSFSPVRRRGGKSGSAKKRAGAGTKGCRERAVKGRGRVRSGVKGTHRSQCTWPALGFPAQGRTRLHRGHAAGRLSPRWMEVRPASEVEPSRARPHKAAQGPCCGPSPQVYSRVEANQALSRMPPIWTAARERIGVPASGKRSSHGAASCSRRRWKKYPASFRQSKKRSTV